MIISVWFRFINNIKHLNHNTCAAELKDGWIDGVLGNTGSTDSFQKVLFFDGKDTGLV